MSVINIPAPAVSVNIKCMCGLHIFTVLVIGWQYVFDYGD